MVVGEGIDTVFQGDYSTVKVTGEFLSEFDKKILYICLQILAYALARGVFLFLTRQTIIVMSRKIEFDLKNDIYEHYQKLPLSFYRSNRTGDLITRISEDVSKSRMYVGPAIMYGLNFIVIFSIIVPLMFYYSVELTLYTLAPLPILSIAVYFVSRKMNKESESIQRSLSNLSSYVQEAFSGIRVIKAFAKEETNAGIFAGESSTYRKKSLKLALINALFVPLIMTLIGLSTILTVYIGSEQVIAGEITVGTIAQFVIYVNMLTWPVTSVGWVTNIVQRAAASQERINEFLETESNILDGDQPIEFEQEIAFKNVSLSYPDSGITALDNISFSIKKGENVAIIGKTGSGKSTVANLLSRSYDPSSGSIFIDDVDLKKCRLESVRKIVGYTPQDSFLFSDSIQDNISFGADNVKETEIIAAATKANVHKDIIEFPNKYETIIGERGITLSGGQKQRITIARALVQKPQLLILDDSLSAVDTETEDQILKNLSEEMKSISSVIISHRISSVKLADKILVLNDGKLVEEGTHDELIKQPGLYAEIYNEQLNKEETS